MTIVIELDRDAVLIFNLARWVLKKTCKS
ncbi:hypothetical protein OIU84_013772 [Salix udensis]|uniref:Uncharacterized protein n=1 Tax=Salix udensis TaxID=889485 RepID=A0AAD6JKU5_9ROSI|nr:hypothetical protein OIU84_013772 [Salix udensis]